MSKPKRVGVPMAGIIAYHEELSRFPLDSHSKHWHADIVKTLRRSVELPPGSVVVTREEARVLRYARMVAREAQESADGSVGASIDSLCAAVAALRATKRRKTR